MATQHLSMSEARARIIRELLTFRRHRNSGLNVGKAAAQMFIPAEAALMYEDALVRLSDLSEDRCAARETAPKNEAAPSSAQPDAAPHQAHHHTEGVIAP